MSSSLLSLIFEAYTFVDDQGRVPIGSDDAGREWMYVWRYRWSAEEKAEHFPGYQVVSLSFPTAIALVQDQREQGLTHVYQQVSQTESRLVPAEQWIAHWTREMANMTEVEREAQARISRMQRRGPGCAVVILFFGLGLLACAGTVAAARQSSLVEVLSGVMRAP